MWSQLQVNMSSCPLHTQGHSGDCTNTRVAAPCHSHPAKTCSLSPGKNLTAASWDSAHREHHGLLSFLCWTLGLKSMRVCPGGRSCLGCPRFGNLEAAAGSPPRRLRKPSSIWRVALGVEVPVPALPGELPSGMSTRRERLFPFPGQGLLPAGAGSLAGRCRRGARMQPLCSGEGRGASLPSLPLPPALAELEGSS